MMGRIDIQESSVVDTNRAADTKSPSPPVRKAIMADKETGKMEPLNSDSGYFEGEGEEDGEAEGEASLQTEASVEIIFDKNASNNNLGKDGKSLNSGKNITFEFYGQ